MGFRWLLAGFLAVTCDLHCEAFANTAVMSTSAITGRCCAAGCDPPPTSRPCEPACESASAALSDGCRVGMTELGVERAGLEAPEALVCMIASVSLLRCSLLLVWLERLLGAFWNWAERGVEGCAKWGLREG
jgi:hypothetical protein